MNEFLAISSVFLQALVALYIFSAQRRQHQKDRESHEAAEKTKNVERQVLKVAEVAEKARAEVAGQREWVLEHFVQKKDFLEYSGALHVQMDKLVDKIERMNQFLLHQQQRQ